MKILRSFYYIGRRSALPIILLMAGASMSAQQRSLQIIPGQSTASIFLGTEENQTSFDVGVARVSGELQLNSDDISASRFNLTISSAGLKNQKFFGERSIITFQSESVEQRKDGELEVAGELTVTQVVARGSGEPSAASSSGDSTPLRTIHRVVFVFSGLEPPEPTSNSGSSNVVLTAEERPESGMLVSAHTSVDGETFPELLFAVQDVAWPPAADDNNCSPPSEPGQNDSGSTCAAGASQAQPSEVDVDPQRKAPAGNLITIKLDLALASADSNSAEQ